MGRYEKFTPVIQLDEITSVEEGILEDLAAISFQTGDLIYYNGADLVKLAIGTSGQALIVSGGLPVWSNDVGSGNVVGPANSVDNQIALFNGATGRLLEASVVSISGTGSISGAEDINLTGDINLSLGSVLNWNSSDVTITHSANLLTIAGGSVTFSSSATFSAGLTATGQVVTGGNFTVDSTTIPVEGMYRPTGAGNLGFSVSSAAELLLTATVFSPAVSDGNSLGSGTLMWGDLYLASGGIIDFNNGDVQITHSANTLAFTGASTGYTFDKMPTVSSIPVGIRSATKVVAANDSLDKTRADYVCDGTNDETEINTAIAAVHANGGGTIVLLEGVYQMGGTSAVASGWGNSASIMFEQVHNITLRGMGRGTVLRIKANTDTNAIDIDATFAGTNRITICDLAIDGNFANFSTPATADSHGMYVEGGSTYAKIENVFIYDTIGAGIYSDVTADTQCINCHITNPHNNYGMHEGGGNRYVILNNKLDGQLGEEYAGVGIYNNDTSCEIIGNSITDIGNGTTGTGIGIENWNDYGVVTGNHIFRTANQGIFFGKTNYCTMIGNTVTMTGQETSNTFAAIEMSSNSSNIPSRYNTVIGNVVSKSGATVHQYAYKEITAGAGNAYPNVVIGNFLKDAGTAAVLLQTGSTTDVSHNVSS